MDLTDETEAKIEEWLGSHSRMPRNDRVSKWLNCSIFEAEGVINEYKQKHGIRVRRNGKSVGYQGNELFAPDPEPEQGSRDEVKEPGRTTGHDRKWFDLAIDGGALVLAVVIDIVLNFVVFTVIAPDLLTKIGMGALSFVVVLFGLRGWIKGGAIGLTLWAMFAIVVTFSDLSFALYVTSVQTESAGVDTELVRLTDKVDHDQKALDLLQDQYNAIGSGFRSELAVRQNAIIDARRALESSEAERRSYIAKNAKDENKQAVLTADGVFSAIPDSLEHGRWIQLVFFTLIFLGLQGTIVVSASASSKDFS